MRSIFNCMNAAQHVNLASTTESPGFVHIPPREITRVEVEHMLTEYVRDASLNENRIGAKQKMLACFDEIHSPTAPSGWCVKPLKIFSKQTKKS